jgi:hypothetical protein
LKRKSAGVFGANRSRSCRVANAAARFAVIPATRKRHVFQSQDSYLCLEESVGSGKVPILIHRERYTNLSE